MAADAPKETPWTLRNHYTITVKRVSLDYAEDNGQWRIRVDGDRAVFDRVGFAIGVEGRDPLTGADLDMAVSSRDKVTTRFGEGSNYALTFPVKDGLEVFHRVTKLDSMPFVILSVGVANKGSEARTISSISSAVIPAGGISNLSPGTELHTYTLHARGGMPVYDPQGGAFFAVLNDANDTTAIALGVLPQYRGASSIELVEEAGTWRGGASTSFGPGISLAPGESVEADPLWLSFGVPDLALVDTYYGWSLAQSPHPAAVGDSPQNWVSVPESGDFAQLLQSVQGWKGSGVWHALIPGNWEGRPGSLQGAAPGYPRDIGNAAQDLRGAGVSPGITLDPLLASGESAWTVQSADGKSWINPGLPEGHAAAEKRVSDLRKKGFEFFVVEPSLVPDEALLKMGLTRAEADRHAFGAAVIGAANAPVLPAATGTLRAEAPAWALAARSTAKMADYQMTVGPLGLDLDNVSSLDAALLAAIKEWKGPIQVTGVPKAAIREGLRGVWGAAKPKARPPSR